MLMPIIAPLMASLRMHTCVALLIAMTHAVCMLTRAAQLIQFLITITDATIL